MKGALRAVRRNLYKPLMLLAGAVLVAALAGVVAAVAELAGWGLAAAGHPVDRPVIYAATGALALGYVAVQVTRGLVTRLGLGETRSLESVAPGLAARADALADEMGIDRPEVVVGPLGAPNAVASGRRGSGTVVLSTELLAVCSPREVEAVMAHEFAHLRARDSVFLTAAGAVQRLVQHLVYVAGSVVLFAIAAAASALARGSAPVFSMVSGLVGGVVRAALWLPLLVVRLFSRQREFHADEVAVRRAGRGEALASALSRIDAAQREAGYDPGGSAALLGIDSPRRAVGVSTHPSTERRIEHIRRLEH